MAGRRNHGLRKRCGCPRTKWPRCPHGWHFNFSWKGESHRVSLDRECGRHIDSKTEAETEADRLRHAIREGTFGMKSSQVTTNTALTFAVFADLFVERARPARRDVTHRANRRAMVRQLAAFSPSGQPFGEKPIGTITEDDFELFMKHLRTQGRAASTRTHYLQLIKTMSAWGVRYGYLDRPWIRPLAELKQEVDTELRREKMAQRNRRLRAGEENAILAGANPRLYRLIVAALETGCRQGELLTLRWQEVSLDRRELRVLAHTAKDDKDRILPISARLLAVLEMARHDPAGHVFGSDAYVFGSEIGEATKSVKTAWATACRKAGVIDLRFHDLRHEAGSRFLEAGWPLHEVQYMLGHADIKTTSTYLNVTLPGLHQSMRKLDQSRQACTNLAQSPPDGPPEAVEDGPEKSRNPLTN
jgi:integrase